MSEFEKEATILKFFSFDHLPQDLKDVSARFYIIAKFVDRALPDNAEKEMALRKLLEAKDCAVRSVIYNRE